jgi:molybdenum-dependent DNA-binding transcriptional regulator ModE
LRRTLDRMVERTVVEREGGGRGRGNAVIFRLAPARLNGHL